MSARPWGRVAIFVVALLVALPGASPGASAEEGDGGLMPRDIEAALAEMDDLGAFFGAFAARDTNGFARERWRRLSLGYPGTAAILRDLLHGGDLFIDDLPEGRASALLDRGEIVVDRDLDGRWRPNLLGNGDAAAAAAVQRRDLLMPELVVALARRQPPQDWPWLADHLRAVGGFGALAQDPVARPLLARFFHAKDAYLWLAMQRIGAGDPAARQGLARRQIETFHAIRDLGTDMAATFGPAPAERLQRDWSEYVGLVDSFAVTRGWLLLDPALRRTRLGAAARLEADAVNQAAAEVVAAAPRSAVAAARGEAEARSARAQAPAPFQVAAPPPAPAVGLDTVMAQAQGIDLDGLAARLPLEALAMRPEAAATSPAALRAFAEGERQLDAARAEVAALRSQVGELATALETRAAEAESLRVALASERDARLASERDARVTNERLAVEAAAAAAAAAEAARRAEAAARIHLAPAPAVAAPEPAAARLEQRQLYIAAVLALVIVAVLLLWLRGRQRAAAVVAPPRLLAAPAAAMPGLAGQPTDTPLSPRPVIEVEGVPLEARPAAPPPPPPSRIRLDGVTAPTAAARAAVKAADVRRAAGQSKGERAVAPPGQAPLGRESDVAAHPIVLALRGSNLPLFEMLFGELADLRAPQLQRIVYGGRGEDLAIVCRAVGVDKLLFGSIFLLTDHLRAGAAEEEPERMAEILQVYDRMPPATARKVLAKWQRDWSGTARQETPAVEPGN